MDVKKENKNIRQLQKICDKDEIYKVWKRSREEYAEDFEAYANAQPEKIRNFLWGFSMGGQMMLQRQVILACRHMHFSGEAEEKAEKSAEKVENTP